VRLWQRARRRGALPVDIVWSPLAKARLAEIHAYISLDNPTAAERLATRIVALTELLKNHPYLGRASGEPGIREMVLAGTPYIIIYRVWRRHVTIKTIWHGKQQRD